MAGNCLLSSMTFRRKSSPWPYAEVREERPDSSRGSVREEGRARKNSIRLRL